MMLADEITKLKDELAARQKARKDANVDSSKEDDMLANLSQMPGWEVLKTQINKTINDLLEPGIGQDSADLATIGAITIAREFTIEALQKVISAVETVKSAKQSAAADAKKTTE